MAETSCDEFPIYFITCHHGAICRSAAGGPVSGNRERRRFRPLPCPLHSPPSPPSPPSLCWRTLSLNAKKPPAASVRHCQCQSLPKDKTHVAVKIYGWLFASSLFHVSAGHFSAMASCLCDSEALSFPPLSFQ